MFGSQSRLQSITVDIKQELEAAVPIHPQLSASIQLPFFIFKNYVFVCGVDMCICTPGIELKRVSDP